MADSGDILRRARQLSSVTQRAHTEERVGVCETGGEYLDHASVAWWGLITCPTCGKKCHVDNVNTYCDNCQTEFEAKITITLTAHRQEKEPA